MAELKIKKRTVSEELGQNGEKSHLQFTSEAFGRGGERFTSQVLRNATPDDIANRLSEMADFLEDMPPPDADPSELLKQIARLREEAVAIRHGGVNISDD